MMSAFLIGLYAMALALPGYSIPQSVPTNPTATSGQQTTGTTSTSAAGASGSGGTGGTFTGVRMTYYAAGLGACGDTNNDQEMIVALNAAQYGNGEYCNKQISITVNGKSQPATIKDKCPGCPFGGLDLTPALFQVFSDLGAGVLTGDWSFTDGSGGNSSQPGSTSGQGSTGAPSAPTIPSTSASVPTTSSVSIPGVTSSPTLAPGAENSPTLAPGAESSPTLAPGVTGATTLQGVPTA